MSHSERVQARKIEPIDRPLGRNWIINDVIAWLADDERRAIGDEHRDALGAIEAGLARTLGRPACPPAAATPMIVRSIVRLVSRHPLARSLTVDALLSLDAAPAPEVLSHG